MQYSVCAASSTLIYIPASPPPPGDDYDEVWDSDRQRLGHSLSPREVALEEEIGEGQFGAVHKGFLYPGVSGLGLTSPVVREGEI